MVKRDDDFIKQFNPETLEQVEQFMKEFNDYLETQIVKIGGNVNEN